MINGLGVLGWGVGGIEAEAAMLGESVSMLVPQVVGFRLSGAMREGATATDLVLTVTQILRQTGVVGKFVEYFGAGVSNLPLADRATIGNMSPEYGATCGFFPVDEITLEYLRLRTPGGANRARRGLLQGESPLARPRPRADLHAGRGARSRRRRAQSRRPAAPAGPRAAHRCQALLPGRARDLRRRLRNQRCEQLAESFPASDPAADSTPGHDGRPSRADRSAGDVIVAERAKPVPVELRRRAVRPRARSRRDRGDHELHEHVEPERDDRRRTRREERRRARAPAETVGQVEPAPGSKVVTEYYERAGLTSTLEDARLPHGRLRLHDLHRELGPAARADLTGRGRRRARRLLGAVGQPELRGADPSG